jgi:hypothetical protein
MASGCHCQAVPVRRTADRDADSSFDEDELELELELELLLLPLPLPLALPPPLICLLADLCTKLVARTSFKFFTSDSRP